MHSNAGSNNKHHGSIHSCHSYARLHLFVWPRSSALGFPPLFHHVSPNPLQIVCDELHHSGRGANRKSPRKGKICDPPSPADLPLRRIAVASDASDTMQCCMARKIFHGLQQSEGTCLPNHIAHSANATNAIARYCKILQVEQCKCQCSPRCFIMLRH